MYIYKQLLVDSGSIVQCSVWRGDTSISDVFLFFVFVFVSLSFPAPRLQSIALQFTDMSLLAHKSIALKEYSDGKLSRVSVAPFHTKSFLSLYLLPLMARLSGALL